MTREFCACGRPLHYGSAAARLKVVDLILRLGPDTTVIIGDRRFRVQRHYIALHGLRGQDLLAGRVPGAVELRA